MAHDVTSLDFNGFGHCSTLEVSFEEIAGMIDGIFLTKSGHVQRWFAHYQRPNVFHEPLPTKISAHTAGIFVYGLSQTELSGKLTCMLGAIAGDIIGSRFEFANIKSKDFDLFSDYSRFTDDSVLSIAVADAILQGGSYQQSMYRYGNNYPGRGYGDRFFEWLKAEYPTPYGSYGNGSAMRVSAVGFAFDSLDQILVEAKKTAEITHDHPEGIKGAQAIAVAIFLARTIGNKEEIKNCVTDLFGYDLERTVDAIRENYEFDETCQGTVPEAIISFLGSTSFEDAIRNSISIGGDSDTIACITGSMAEAFY